MSNQRRSKWPANEHTEKLNRWLLESADNDIEWPAKKICDVAASISATFLDGYHMMPDSDGGIVFVRIENNGGQCRVHLFDDGDIYSTYISDGIVISHDKMTQGDFE